MDLDVARLLKRPGHEAVLHNQRLTIEGSGISAIAPCEAVARDLLAIPALINAHDHGRGLKTLAFGCCDGPLELWLLGLGSEPRVDPYLRAAVSFARMALGGIAAANHCHNPQNREAMLIEAEAISQATRDVGIRIAFAVPVFDRNPIVYGPTAPIEAALGAEAFSRLVERNQRAPSDVQLDLVQACESFDHELFSVQYGPVGPQWCENGTLEKIAQASADKGRRIHMHLFETERQRQWADHTYPGGLVRFLDEIGFLSPRLTVAHGVWLRPDECELLAERGATVSLNMSSNLRLRSGIPSASRFKKAGLNWAMGMDGMAFDDDEDALRELRMIWHIQQSTSIHQNLSPAEVFDGGMVNGRHTIIPGDDGGVLEPGRPADILVLKRSEMVPDCLEEAADDAHLILTRAAKSHIDRLIVAGRPIVANGQNVDFDLEQAEMELLDQARHGWPAKQTEIDEIHRLRTVIEDYYGSYAHLSG